MTEPSEGETGEEEPLNPGEIPPAGETGEGEGSTGETGETGEGDPAPEGETETPSEEPVPPPEEPVPPPTEQPDQNSSGEQTE